MHGLNALLDASVQLCSYVLQSIKCDMTTSYDQASLAGREQRLAGSECRFVETAIGALGGVSDAGGDTTEGDAKWRLWTSAVS